MYNVLIAFWLIVFPNGWFTHVLVLKQPSFVMLPVYVNDPWFDVKGLQIIEEIKKVLSR